MEKVIKIGKQSVKLTNNVAWTIEYRDQFGKDIVPVLLPVMASIMEGISTIVSETDGTIDVRHVAESINGRSLEILLPLFQTEFVDVIINVTWAMAKAADENIEPPKQWVRNFDIFPLDVVVPAVYEMVMKGFVSSKNWKRLMTLMQTIQPSHSMTSSSLDSNEVSE